MSLHPKRLTGSDLITIVNWNIAWRNHNSAHGRDIQRRMEACAPDVICLTEASSSFGQKGFESADAHPDYGYPIIQGRRKVRLLSRPPLVDIDTIGDSSMPPGRFVAASIQTRLGNIRIIGVCIPWMSAHVATGRKNRNAWEEHMAYLSGLARVLSAIDKPAILVGDFNQTVPRSRAPNRVYDAMISALSEKFNLATSGQIPGAESLSIDHVAMTEHFDVINVHAISNVAENGQQLSDHFGLAVSLRSRFPASSIHGAR